MISIRQQVFALAASDLTPAEIAARLGCKRKTVYNYLLASSRGGARTSRSVAVQVEIERLAAQGLSRLEIFSSVCERFPSTRMQTIDNCLCRLRKKNPDLSRRREAQLRIRVPVDQLERLKLEADDRNVSLEELCAKIFANIIESEIFDAVLEEG